MSSMSPRHFLDIADLDPQTLRHLLGVARDLKAGNVLPGQSDQPLRGKALAMLFEKPSTRTRVSFEVAMTQLGGHAVLLEGGGSQLARGETFADTARVLSRYVDAIMIRTTGDERLREVADNATVPVINGLTDWSHPCQILADIQTIEQHRGPIAGKTVAWSGDANNVTNSWIQAAARLDFALRIACPPQLSPAPQILQWVADNAADVSVTAEPGTAVAGADAVVTDTWVSMGDDAGESRHNLLAPYAVDRQLMAAAKPDAVFLHCLPAHRGEEVSAEVMDGPQSVVWDEAENRLHAQKAILAWCFECV